MGILDSYFEAWKILGKKTVILFPALLLVILKTPVFVSDVFGMKISIISQILIIIYSLLMWFLIPLVAGATIGAIKRIKNGEDISYNVLLEDGKKNYVNLLMSGIIMLLIIFTSILTLILGTVIIFTISKVIIHSATFVFSSMFIFLSSLSVIIAILLIMLQFYGTAIVIDSLSPVDSFKRSFGFSRSRLLSVIGVSVMKFLTSVFLALPVVIIIGYHILTNFQNTITLGSFTGNFPNPGFGVSFSALIVDIIFGTLSMCFIYVYEAIYYIDENRREHV
ncbi:MAG TPA: hypothetical protein ENH28_04445 [Euryarchaeota archaeon]|nr:hypothetical protein BMS3Bbin15_00236 [archaeon BMS3Bbin15]HDL15387.1 hypothetical protein [Euryarchaeota archaeon]